MKCVGRKALDGKSKGGMKVHTMLNELIDKIEKDWWRKHTLNPVAVAVLFDG